MRESTREGRQKEKEGKEEREGIMRELRESRR